MIIWVLVALFFTPSALTSENCDKFGRLFYEDIACKPIKEDGQECPKKFDCNFAQPKSGCLFKGNSYQTRQEIESNLTYSACSIGCFCEDTNTFRCAILDCPEHFGRVPEPGCHLGYELGRCCSTGNVCNSTKTCQVDGQTYLEGQKFYPKDTCLTCVCHENFTGQLDEQTCRRQNCNSQIHYASEIAQKCAPAYFKYDSDQVLCCPSDFVCPQSSDKIRLINRDVKADSELTCSYGEQSLKLGEGFTTHVEKYGKKRELECECVLPPLVTCKEV